MRLELQPGAPRPVRETGLQLADHGLIANQVQPAQLLPQVGWRLLQRDAQFAGHRPGVDQTIAELERRLGYSASYREKAIAERDKDIAEGKYAEQANSTRQEVAKAEAKLLRLKSGPLPEFDRPFVRSWHQGRNLVRRPEPGQKLVDIIEIKVP